MSADHVCRCRQCEPDAFPSGPRQGEHHAAVRFGEVAIWDVWLNGEPMAHVTEAFAGRDGAIYANPDPLHRCRNCFMDYCEQRLLGAVQIARKVLV